MYRGFLLRYAWDCAPDNKVLYTMRDEFSKRIQEICGKVDRSGSGDKMPHFNVYNGVKAAMCILHARKQNEQAATSSPTKGSKKAQAPAAKKPGGKKSGAGSSSGNAEDHE